MKHTRSNKILRGGYNQNHENNYDLLRIVVILIHVNWYRFGERYNTPDSSLLWTIEALVNIMTRFSVPVFVMLSGAYNLRAYRQIQRYGERGMGIRWKTGLKLSENDMRWGCIEIQNRQTPKTSGDISTLRIDDKYPKNSAHIL